uniref:Uncharacterized protein n=1 Tax=Megaselia scalaris TaxID=36166 RepID=T1GC19_MEGSC
MKVANIGNSSPCCSRLKESINREEYSLPVFLDIESAFNNVKADSIADPFCFIKSEHLLLKELKKLNLMQDFTEFPINEEEMIKNRDKYINEKSDEIKHFVQCRTWEKIVSKVETNDNTILLPIGLYSDGMQYNNPLGAHSESSEMLHYFFPCLDDPLNESNTFLASIVMSKDVKSYGNGSCFSPLIDVFNKLFTKGISVEIDGSIKTIKFLLGNITGDNLAMNAILDYILYMQF